MKTKQEFIERWKKHVAGMAMFGMASERNDGPLLRASKLFELPAEVEKLLGQMYDDVTAVPKEIKPVVNGSTNTTTMAKQTIKT